MISLVGKRIVILEDEGLTLLGLIRVCEQARMIVAGTAHNGRDGVEVILQQRPDLVLADVHMPVMDGMETARQILSQLRVCVLLITAYSDTTDLGAIMSLGIHGYLKKPVTREVLIPAIEEAYETFLQGKTFAF